MLFSSMIFIWIFLPLVLTVNFLIDILPFGSRKTKVKVKNCFLLISSLTFYAWGGVYYLLVMLSSIMINYTGGLLIGRNRNRGRMFLAMAVILNLAVLFYFKYFNMILGIVENIMAGTGIGGILSLRRTGSIPLKDVVLPIGISFFTFQSMSYIIDVYRNKAEVQPDIISFALYVSLFPQLIAGPIVKYTDVEKQLADRKTTLENVHYGVKRFCYGLGKKVLIANTMAVIADGIWSLELGRMGASVAWLGLVAYTLQIYYDFSGYSDMAIGIGRMLGFTFNENFNYPYTAITVMDFWRRWHISLTSWFREYVYFPLGGSRDGEIRTYRNIIIVFLLTGIWHGANFTFIVWGLYFAVIQIFERAYYRKWKVSNPLLNWCLTIFLVMIGWALFRSNTLSEAMLYISRLFCRGDSTYDLVTFLSGKSVVALIAGILFCGFIQRLFLYFFRNAGKSGFFMLVEGIFQFVILALSIVSLVAGTYNPFIYFQF